MKYNIIIKNYFKLVFGLYYFSGFYYFSGLYSFTFYIPFNSIVEGKKLERFLNSKEYKTLALATKTTRQYLKIAFIEYLKLTTIMGSNNKTKKQTKKQNNKTRKHK